MTYETFKAKKKHGLKTKRNVWHHFSPSVLRVHAAERHTVDRIMSSEEHSAKHLKVNSSNLHISYFPKTKTWASSAYLRWLSVSVMPWADTLKWTTVAEGRGLRDTVAPAALAMACGPVRDSVSTEFRYSTLQADGRSERLNKKDEYWIYIITHTHSPAPCFSRSAAVLILLDGWTSWTSPMGSVNVIVKIYRWVCKIQTLL